MSRSGYSEDLDNWQLIKWRGMVASSTRGRRGQQFFKDLLAALETMPKKALIANRLVEDGEVCAIGSLGRARGINMNEIDPDDPSQVSHAFDIAECLAQEVVYMNDECRTRETAEQRWTRMHQWVKSQINVHDDAEGCERKKGGAVIESHERRESIRKLKDPTPQEEQQQDLNAVIGILAAELHTAWRKYEDNFGEPPHGTMHQLKALLCFTTIPQRIAQTLTTDGGSEDVNSEKPGDSRQLARGSDEPAK